MKTISGSLTHEPLPDVTLMAELNTSMC